jgi:hypothetical protein
MPKVLRKDLPFALFRHLRDRVKQREIASDQLILFTRWLNTNPEVPVGRWFKRFPRMTVCGEGVYVKTFLRLGQVAEGEEVM